MANNCCEGGSDIMILACSGGSNVGQLSNQAAVELTKEGFGKMFCLAGIGGKLSGFIQSAKDVPTLVVIDGCEIGCAKNTLKEANVPLGNYIVITSLGIEKNKNFDLDRDQIEMVKREVKLAVARSLAGPRPGGGCCCCG